MKIIIGILLIIMMIGVNGCSLIKQCPSENVIMSGNVYCNGEWRDIFMEIEKGELDNPENYMTEEQWEKAQKNILFDKEYKDLEKEKKDPDESPLGDLIDSLIKLGTELNK